MRPKPIRPPRPSGSVLVLVILAIVFLGALAAGVVSLLGAGDMDTAASNQAEKVYYNAESGYRYLDQQYTSQSDANGNGFDDDDKAGVLIALDGATVSLPGNLGSFTLDVQPYWFIATASYAGATSITVRFPGSMPAGYTIPTTGVVEVEGNSPHAYTSASVNAPFVTFTLSTPVTLDSGKSVFMTLSPTGSQSVAKGGSLTLSSSSGTVFPERNGQIQVNNDVATYSTAGFDAGSGVLTLGGLSKALNVGSGDRVVLKKSAFISSTGQAGAGSFATANEVKYNITFTDSIPPGGSNQGTGPKIEDTLDSTDGVSIRSSQGSGYSTGQYTSADGTTRTYVVSRQSGEARDPDSACSSHIRWGFADVNNATLFADAWQNASSHLLSYDFQAKNAWGYQLDYGVGGLTFRVHEAGSGLYNLMGLSFMRYKHANSCLYPQGQRDDIPDSIKPTAADGSSLAGRCLLVLWIQEVSGGAEHRTWVAYKDLTDDACVTGPQWSGDGQCVSDDATLMVRVVERMVNGAKTSDISAFYGDASNPANPGWWEHAGGWNWIYHPGGCGPRTPNAISYDRGTLRQVYYKDESYTSGQSPFSTFPPDDLANWNSTVDYFSFVKHGGGNPVACSLCDWDRINPSASASFLLQSDGGTLRTAKFLSPASGAFPTATRKEIGFNNFNGGSGNSVIGHKDIALQFLVPNPGTIGSISGAVMY